MPFIYTSRSFIFVCQRIFENIFNLNITNRTTLHRKQVIFLVNLAPVNNLSDFFSKSNQPNTSCSAVALTKRMSDVHSTYFSIISSNEIEAFYQYSQVPNTNTSTNKAKIPLCNIYFSDFSRKVVNIFK